MIAVPPSPAASRRSTASTASSNSNFRANRPPLLVVAGMLGALVTLLAPPAHGQQAPSAPSPPTAATDVADEADGDVPTSPDAPGTDTGPSPEAIADARIRYQRGLELYRAGDFKLSLIEFQRSYEIAPNYRILFNVGQVNMQLNRYAKALKAFRQYLDEGGDDVDAERREQIETELAMLTGRTATVSVTSNVEGATVLIDGVPVGTTPLSALLVDAGEHSVTVSMEGRSKSEYVVLAGKEDATLNIVVPQPKPPAPAPPPPPPSTIIVDNTKESKAVGVPVIVGWSITGALTAAAIGTGVAALGAQSDLDEVRSGATTKSALEDANDEATMLSVTTDVLIGAAILAGGVSLYLTLTDGEEEEEGGHAELGVGPGSLTLTGTF